MNSLISLARIYYPVMVLGPGKRVGIWLNGCMRNCPGCISPEMKVYDTTKEMSINDIIDFVQKINKPIEGFTISGGEPFFRPQSLNELVCRLSAINDDILIYTGYTMKELKEKKDHNIENVLTNCAAIIDGPYIMDLDDNGALRGSSNQKCWIFKHQEKYSLFKPKERELQTVVAGEKVISIGIPKGATIK